MIGNSGMQSAAALATLSVCKSNLTCSKSCLPNAVNLWDRIGWILQVKVCIGNKNSLSSFYPWEWQWTCCILGTGIKAPVIKIATQEGETPITVYSILCCCRVAIVKPQSVQWTVFRHHSASLKLMLFSIQFLYDYDCRLNARCGTFHGREQQFK